jgi:hypothetical protein
MAKTKISEFDANPANNTDIDGINLAEGMAPGLVNNAIRQLMAQLKDFQIGSAGDNLTVGGNLVVTGTGTLSGRTIDALPSGTKMLFQQTSAPTGWTKDTTHDNKALRVVSGTAGSGGSVNFTTAFGSQNVGGTALTSAQIPGHTHTFSGSGNTGDAGGHTHTGATNSAGNHSHVYTRYSALRGSPTGNDTWAGTANVNTSVAGAHTHSLSIDAVANHNHTVSVSGTTSSTGGGDTHTHSLNLAVQYVDIIICTKT